MLFRSNDTATTDIYTVRNTLSLHDALPICSKRILTYPGDASHPVPVRAMRGPTRLQLLQGRFVPLGGMAELLD